MPEPYWPKKGDYPLSRLNEGGARYVRIACRQCKRAHNYFPSDLIQIFGDADIDSLTTRMRCEGDQCRPGTLMVTMFVPTGSEGVGLRMRRLVSIRIQRIPVWRED